MISDYTDGLVSLLQTNNVAVLDKLLETGIINAIQMPELIKKSVHSHNHAYDKDFVAMLVNDYDIIDKETAAKLVYLLLDAHDGKIHMWNEDRMYAFIKLVDYGITLIVQDILNLPYDAFVYYVEKNGHVICGTTLLWMVNKLVSSDIESFLVERLECDLISMSYFELLTCAAVSIANNYPDSIVREIILREIDKRSIFDHLIMYLLLSRYRQDIDFFFEKHISACENADIFAFFRTCTICADTLEKVDDKFTALTEFLKSGSGFEMYHEIAKSKMYTHEDMSCILLKMKRLMELCITKY